MTVALFNDGQWRKVKRCDVQARLLADRHYSRQTPGAQEFMSNGRTLVLTTDDGLAVWGAIENKDPAGGHRWRCSIFRNEGPVRSSELVREGTLRTVEYWRRKYRGLPAVPLTTEIDPGKVRRKRDPGRCFIKAGWVKVDERRGLVVLQAPVCALRGHDVFVHEVVGMRFPICLQCGKVNYAWGDAA